MFKLVLLRHGESEWNLENRFSGWADIGLTEKGMSEAKRFGLLLKGQNFRFDVVFTSVLKKAIKNMEICLSEMGPSVFSPFMTGVSTSNTMGL